MITKIEKRTELFIQIKPSDLMRLAKSVQYAIDHKERGHIRANERIINDDYEIVFVGVADD